MNTRLFAAIGATVGAVCLLALSAILLRGHFAMLKDIREYALPLAAELPPLESRVKILREQVELSELQASLRSDTSEEKLHVYVVPAGEDLKRLLAFLETMRTVLEHRKLARSFSPIEVGDPQDSALGNGLRERTIRFSVDVRTEGRSQLHAILNLSGLLTVGDALSPDNIRNLFGLTETQNYAGIVPMEKFLSADLLGYVQDPRLYDERLSAALSSEEFLGSFKQLLQSSQLSQVKELLKSDLGRTLVAQKLWPVQFITVEKEELRTKSDGWENVELTLKAYSRKS